MQAELVKTFRFDAAHRLPNVPAGHKCASPHGHSYRVDVHVTGPVDPTTGWVMDFGVIKKVVQPIIERIDHHNLNDVPGLENSTSECIAAWLWEQIRPAIPLLSAITVHETDSSRCIYRGQ
jgi:6-pyruvoyltetrahydropterin/6-carboxytetrahydropterin synthase